MPELSLRHAFVMLFGENLLSRAFPAFSSNVDSCTVIVGSKQRYNAFGI